jgi:hypothetical protein
MEEVNEAHELPERQSETGGSQERKSLGVPVERGSAGRRNPSKAHRQWNAGRLADGVSRPSRGRRDPLRDQPTTPQRLIKKIGFETLVNHYRQHELPDTFNKTKPVPDAADEVTYEGYLKKWISTCTGHQGEDQKHHECALFTCDQMGMDGEESDYERSPERKTAESTRHSDTGRNHGISQGTARSTPIR